MVICVTDGSVVVRVDSRLMQAGDLQQLERPRTAQLGALRSGSGPRAAHA